MLTDLLMSIILLFFITFGLQRPHIALCAVVWVDVMRPQALSVSFLSGKPISAIVVGFFFISILLNWNKWKLPSKTLHTFFVVVFMVWITVTTFHAQFPAHAWWKYDFSIKTILVASLIPLVITARYKLESVLWTYVVSVGFFCMMAGMKTAGGGSGYKMQMLNKFSGGITESSTLAAAAISCIPLMIYLSQHALIVRRYPFLKYVMYALAFAALMTTIGTHARTGLVCLAALIGFYALKSKRKLHYIIVTGLTVLLALAFTGKDWMDRMDTISSAKQENSAFGRIVVWRWTVDYVRNRPWMGGGFQSYLANAGQIKKYVREGESLSLNVPAKSSHSIYFEMLGEHGYVGLLLFLLLLTHVLLSNRVVARQRTHPPWLKEAGISLSRAIMVFCIGGLFIHGTFLPVLWILFGLSVSLRNLESQAKESAEAIPKIQVIERPKSIYGELRREVRS
jgi:probable O-glycosylation ligase (exosortase A-associated)